MLALRPGSWWGWSTPGRMPGERPEDYDEGIDREHMSRKIEFGKSRGCAYQIACELGSLNLSGQELYSDGGQFSGQFPYHYGSDFTVDGRTTVSMSGGGTMAFCLGVYSDGFFGANEDEYGWSQSIAPLFGVELGSDEHFDDLLNCEDAFVFVPAFGRKFTDAYFNVLTHVRKFWPQICRRMRALDDRLRRIDDSDYDFDEDEDDESDDFSSGNCTAPGWSTPKVPSHSTLRGDYFRYSY